MLKRILACTACAALFYSSTDCVTEAKPPVQKCPTTAQTVTFVAAGSCGPAGEITVTTDPGLCAITVATVCVGSTDCSNVLPTGGSFTGDAQLTNYDVSQGNWMLLGTSSDPQADPSSTDCDANSANDAGSILVNCNINSCVPSGEDTGSQCS
jgi:hypothetical protein